MLIVMAYLNTVGAVVLLGVWIFLGLTRAGQLLNQAIRDGLGDEHARLQDRVLERVVNELRNVSGDSMRSDRWGHLAQIVVTACLWPVSLQRALEPIAEVIRRAIELEVSQERINQDRGLMQLNGNDWLIVWLQPEAGMLYEKQWAAILDGDSTQGRGYVTGWDHADRLGSLLVRWSSEPCALAELVMDDGSDPPRRMDGSHFPIATVEGPMSAIVSVDADR